MGHIRTGRSAKKPSTISASIDKVLLKVGTVDASVKSADCDATDISFFGPDDLQKTEDILERICQVSDSGFLFQQDRAGAALCLILRRTIRML